MHAKELQAETACHQGDHERIKAGALRANDNAAQHGNAACDKEYTVCEPSKIALNACAGNCVST